MSASPNLRTGILVGVYVFVSGAACLLIFGTPLGSEIWLLLLALALAVLLVNRWISTRAKRTRDVQVRRAVDDSKRA